jgi:hypothetical protein
MSLRRERGRNRGWLARFPTAGSWPQADAFDHLFLPSGARFNNSEAEMNDVALKARVSGV